MDVIPKVAFMNKKINKKKAPQSLFQNTILALETKRESTEAARLISKFGAWHFSPGAISVSWRHQMAPLRLMEAGWGEAFPSINIMCLLMYTCSYHGLEEMAFWGLWSISLSAGKVGWFPIYKRGFSIIRTRVVRPRLLRLKRNQVAVKNKET